MSNPIITSTVENAAPTIDQLPEGVVGVNTKDAILYVNNGTEIVEYLLSKELSGFINDVGFLVQSEVDDRITTKIKTSTTGGSVPTTSTLPQGTLEVNTKDAILYVNNGTEILKLRFGGNVFKPSGYLQSETFTLLRDDVSVGQWVSVLNLNSSLNVTSLILSTRLGVSTDNSVVEVRVTRDGEVLPVMQVSKVSGISGNLAKHYVGKFHTEVRFQDPSSTAATASQLSSSHGLYCRDSLLVELRIVSGDSANCGGVVNVDYQEGVYE